MSTALLEQPTQVPARGDHRAARARRVAARRAAGGGVRAAARRDAAPHQDPPRQLLRRRAAPAVRRLHQRGASARATTSSCSSNLFEMSYEAVAHRVCNLGDPKRPGIPHALRPLRRGRQHLQALLGDGAALPRGVGLVRQVGGAQRLPDPVGDHAAVLVMPDGATYFCFAKVPTQPQQGSLVRGTTYSIGLGTHADAARAPGLRAGHAVHRSPRWRSRSASAAASASAPTAISARRRAYKFALQRRRVHQEGQFLLSARRDRPLRVSTACAAVTGAHLAPSTPDGCKQYDRRRR